MRRFALAMALAAAIPQVGRADDLDLPPPQVIPRTRGGRPVAPPARTPAQRPTAPALPPGAVVPPPSQRAIDRDVDDYLRDARPLIAPSSGGGIVAYDQGFLIRNAGFSLRAFTKALSRML